MGRWKDELEQTWMPRRTGDDDASPVIPGEREKLLDAIAEMAFRHLAVYGNCCRSTLWAVQTHLRSEDAGTLRASAVLAGGIAGTGQTCGAVLGGLIAIGQFLASDEFRDVETNQRADASARTLVQELHSLYGSTNCYEIQEALMGFRCDQPSRHRRWLEEGGSTACASVCAQVARRAAAILLDEQAGLEE